MRLHPETLGHHAEATDPTLVEWIKDRLDHLLGLEATTVVIVLGLVLVLFPLTLIVLARRQRRRTEQAMAESELRRSVESRDPSEPAD